MAWRQDRFCFYINQLLIDKVDCVRVSSSFNLSNPVVWQSQFGVYVRNTNYFNTNYWLILWHTYDDCLSAAISATVWTAWQHTPTQSTAINTSDVMRTNRPGVKWCGNGRCRLHGQICMYIHSDCGGNGGRYIIIVSQNQPRLPNNFSYSLKCLGMRLKFNYVIILYNITGLCYCVYVLSTSILVRLIIMVLHSNLIFEAKGVMWFVDTA